MAGLVALTLAPARAVTQSEKQTAASAQTPGSQSNTTGKRVASGLDRALIRAAAAGDISGIDELLRAGANVNCTVPMGEFPSSLTGAAHKGRLDAVRLLLDWGDDPNLWPRLKTPLIYAAEAGHVEIVSLLLD